MTEVAVRRPEARRMGFFTDTTTCIGCKACEVACKQWNDLPAEGGTLRAGENVLAHRHDPPPHVSVREDHPAEERPSR